MGLAPPLPGARRARGRSTTCSCSKTAASRSASRCTIPTGRSTATRSCRRCPRSSSPPTRASAAARRARCSRASSTTGGASIYENEASSRTSPTPRAGPMKRTSCMREHRPSLLECEPGELKRAGGRPAGARARLRRPVRAAVPVRDGRPPGAHPHRARGSAGTCTSSSTRRCAPPTSSSTSAGSEQGAGTFISDMLPEESAAHAARGDRPCRLSERRAGSRPRVRARTRQPDRRAHRLQRRARAAVRDRRGRHRRAGAAQPARPARSAIHAHARDLGERDEFALADPRPRRGWRAFVRGAVAELRRAGWVPARRRELRDRRRRAARRRRCPPRRRSRSRCAWR